MGAREDSVDFKMASSAKTNNYLINYFCIYQS